MESSGFSSIAAEPDFTATMMHMAAHKAAPNMVTVPSKRGQALSGITSTSPPPPDIINNVQDINIPTIVVAQVGILGRNISTSFITAKISITPPSKRGQALFITKRKDANITISVVAQVATRGKIIITANVSITPPSKRGQAVSGITPTPPPDVIIKVEDTSITISVVAQVATGGKISSLEVLPRNLPSRLTIGKVHVATPISPAITMRSESDSGIIIIKAVVNPKRSIKAPIMLRTKPQMDVSGFSTIVEAPIVDPRTTHQSAPKILTVIMIAAERICPSSITLPPPSFL